VRALRALFCAPYNEWQLHSSAQQTTTSRHWQAVDSNSSVTWRIKNYSRRKVVENIEKVTSSAFSFPSRSPFFTTSSLCVMEEISPPWDHKEGPQRVPMDWRSLRRLPHEMREVYQKVSCSPASEGRQQLLIG